MLEQTGHTNLPGNGAGIPALVSSGDGRLDGFVVQGNTVWWAACKHQDPQKHPSWGKRYQLPGNRSDVADLGVTAASANPGEIDVVGVGQGPFDGQLLHWALRSGTWTQRSLPGSSNMARSPARVVSRARGLIDVFGVDKSQRIRRWRREHGTWRPGGPFPLPGDKRVVLQPPAVAVTAPQRLDIFATDAGRDRVWHWWSDDGEHFGGPEPLDQQGRMADEPLAAAWSQSGGVLEAVGVLDGNLLTPRSLAKWRWSVDTPFKGSRLARASGFTGNGEAAVWLEGATPALAARGDGTRAAAVSALRNVTEQHAFTRNLVTWEGDRQVRRVGLEGATDRGLTILTRGGAALDALLDAEGETLHLWSGHHEGLPRRIGTPTNVTADWRSDGLALSWQHEMPGWAGKVEYHLTTWDRDGNLVQQTTARQPSVVLRSGNQKEEPTGGSHWEWQPNPDPRTRDEEPYVQVLVPNTRLVLVRTARIRIETHGTVTRGVARWAGDYADRSTTEVRV